MAQFIGSTIRKLTEEELDGLKKVYPHRTYFKWVTEGEFKWLHKGEYIVVPKGFLCDGSSGGPDFGHSWLIHDWLYLTHIIGDRLITREEADSIMIDILKWERANVYSKIVEWVVRLNPFNKLSDAWTRGVSPAFIQDIDMNSAMSEDSDGSEMKEVSLE